jgi:opacity protein-like surface antigen
LRPGVLQDQAGPSIATEFGVLLPDSIGDTRFGASIAGIVSQRWDWGTAHLNIAGQLTRDQHADLFTGIILEGPNKWTVRPVAEFFYEEEFGQAHTVSALVGAIWQVKDNLSFDVGFRHAITNGVNINEVRAGLTYGFPLRLLGPSHK